MLACAVHINSINLHGVRVNEKDGSNSMKISKTPTDIKYLFGNAWQFCWHYFSHFRTTCHIFSTETHDEMWWNQDHIAIQNVEHYDFRWDSDPFFFFAMFFFSSSLVCLLMPFDVIICAALCTSHCILHGKRRRRRQQQRKCHGNSFRGKSMRHTRKLWQNTECKKVIYAVSD